MSDLDIHLGGLSVMRLKKTADVMKFLEAVSHCRKDVYFCTKDGDRLNLGSELMRFVMISQRENQEFIYGSTIELTEPDDYRVLEAFVEL